MKNYPNNALFRVLTFLLAIAIVFPAPSALAQSPQPTVEVIVQGTPSANLKDLIEAAGGEVTRDLYVIDAVAASVPTDRLELLIADNPSIHIWQDSPVHSADSADPGQIVAPFAGYEYAEADFKLDEVIACDGKRDKLDEIGQAPLDPNEFQSYRFSPSVDPSNMPQSIGLLFCVQGEKTRQCTLAGAASFNPNMAYLSHRYPDQRG